MRKITAGIIVIGDEILSGRTKDSNSNFMAKNLIKVGIRLDEIKIIKDEKDIIIDNILNFHNKFSYVFTTGGIGPTHDDITSESISKAFNKEYCFNSEALRILENYYPPGEFNTGRKKMAKMPKDSKLILNPLTAAPGFIVNNVYVFPGVPKIMEQMFLNILDSIKSGSPKKIISINTNLYESAIAVKLEKIQNNNLDCSIGSYPYFNYDSKSGGVNIVISSWTIDNLDPIKNQIIEMISFLGGKSSIV